MARGEGGTDQKATETSLIERFLYPKLGPGQLWEIVAERIRAGGGEIRLGQRVVGIRHDGRSVSDVEVRDRDGSTYRIDAAHLISTMPISELVGALSPAAPAAVRAVGDELPYRDFMTAGLLVPRMTPPPGTPADARTGMPPDNWIYVQEPDVRMGRIQIFNNWSPAMVASRPKIFLGLEYFCQDGDELWSMPDERFLRSRHASSRRSDWPARRRSRTAWSCACPRPTPRTSGAMPGSKPSGLRGHARQSVARRPQRHASL